LLGVLVNKGVLSPTEADAIRNAVPTAQFQALVEALLRKGIVSAQDLSAVAAARPYAQPLVAAAPATMALATPAAQPATPAPAQKTLEGPAVVPAIAPLRVLPLDPPMKDGLLPSFKAGAVRVTPYVASTQYLDVRGVF
jgi:hypothetical protein